MNKIELLYSPYELKFRKPFETSGGAITHRRGFHIKLTNGKNLTALGDVSPFPEYGSETYEAAENCLNNFSRDIKIDLDNFELSFQKNFSDLQEYPALRCGLEQALLTLLTTEKNISINEVLNTRSLPRVKVNAVIPFDTPKNSAALAERYAYDGFTTIKLKVGRDNFIDDLNCVESVRSEIGNTLKIRLDVNGTWNVESAIERMEKLAKYNIEFVEQPVNSLKEFCELQRKTSIALAADESVRNIKDAVDFIRSGSVKYLVIKPMMIGGLAPLLSIYEEAKLHGVKVVVTSSFESGVGFSYAVFAASLISENIAHGLATMEYFETRVLPEPYYIKDGYIQL